MRGGAARLACLALLALPCAAGRAVAIRRLPTRAPRAHPVAVLDFFAGMLGGADESLEESGLVPDVWPEPFDVTVDLRVRYPAWVRSSVDLRDVRSFGDTPVEGAGLLRKRGVTVAPTQVRDAPRLEWKAADASKHYAVLMLDPDAPRPDAPTARSFVHWAVVNIPGSELELGEVRRPYVGAFPPAGTGVHRYFFLLLEQREGQQDFGPGLPEAEWRSALDLDTRAGWDCSAFAREHGLTPVGWHCFRAEYDAYALELMQTLQAAG